VKTRSAAEVFVDFAHTDDALANVLSTVRAFTKGKVWAVFGAGGDRDRAKRPLMGAAAARHADRLVVTSDNPRSERPEDIIAEIVAGIPAGAAVTVEPDRRAAIHYALAHAAPGDTVVVCGKGHETTQTIGARVLPFDDRIVCAEY
jgi:UDP-N-acetylmuramoyl-L-alanyl-D-glutamate--2,6-diaminopimelate ligase